MSSLDLNRRRFLAGAGTTAAAALVGVAGSTLVGASGAAWGAAPMLGPVEPKVYRFKLGGFEATMIADSNAFVDGPWPLIGGNAERSAVDELMTANLLPANKYQPGFTPMIVNTRKQVVIFDTGNGERGFVPRPKGGWLAKQLEPAGFKPEQIDVVVLSHGHPDHSAESWRTANRSSPTRAMPPAPSTTTIGAATAPRVTWRNKPLCIEITSFPWPKRPPSSIRATR